MSIPWLFISGCVSVATLMLVFFLIQLRTKNAGILDLGWTLGIFILALLYAVVLPGYFWRDLIVVAIVGAWSLRLSQHIFRRLQNEGEDRRYRQLRQVWQPHFQSKLLALFIFEALLCMVLSIPFLLICLNDASSLSAFEFAGLALWIVGFLGEMIADNQLKNFKDDPMNKGVLCQRGLWGYSRHPNYFFEWVMWVAYFIFALGSPQGWLAVISPLIMYFLLTKVTGIPMIEEHALKTKGEAFRQYQETTSAFFPIRRHLPRSA